MLGNGAGESGLFQSTRPLRGGTFRLGLGTMNCKFQSTRPLRGGTTKFVQMVITSRFQSPRPLRGGTAGHDSAELVTWISIHPPLAGRDPDDVQGQPLFADFNPPAPCGAGQKAGAGKIHRRRFQSTRPLRGGTIWAITSPRAARFQSTRPLRGGTGKDRAPEHFGKISIHPPLAGRDSDLAQKNCAKHRILHKKCIYPGRIERFSGSDAAIFLPNVHKFRCEPSEESLLTPRSHAYTIRTPSG